MGLDLFEHSWQFLWATDARIFNFRGPWQKNQPSGIVNKRCSALMGAEFIRAFVAICFSWPQIHEYSL